MTTTHERQATMYTVGSGENEVAIKRSGGAVLLSVGGEVVVLSIRDARDLAAEINRIVRAPRERKSTSR